MAKAKGHQNAPSHIHIRTWALRPLSLASFGVAGMPGTEVRRLAAYGMQEDIRKQELAPLPPTPKHHLLQSEAAIAVAQSIL